MLIFNENNGTMIFCSASSLLDQDVVASELFPNNGYVIFKTVTIANKFIIHT